MTGIEKELFNLSSFIRGTAVLMVAVFLSKLLGFVYPNPIHAIAGEESVGIYMTAYPAFIFFLSLVQLGVPIAIAKVIAELEAKGERAKIPAVMKTATFITILTGYGFHPGFDSCSSLIWQETLLGNPRFFTALYAGIAIVPIAAIGGLIRGYFQGIHVLKKRPGLKLSNSFSASY